MSECLFPNFYIKSKQMSTVVLPGLILPRSRQQRYLPLHTDESTHSCTIALNSIDEYEGGGTYFASADETIRPDMGHVLTFDGNTLHGGAPVLSGTRYILAVFMYLTTTQKSKENDLHKRQKILGE